MEMVKRKKVSGNAVIYRCNVKAVKENVKWENG